MKENDILEKVGGKTGYTVPPDYFDSVRSKIMNNLPDYPVASEEKPSVWRRIQPYLYMAAMFAGIWCMMKMFHMMTTSDLSLDNPPESVAVAMANSDHDDWAYLPDENAGAFMLEDELCETYSTIDDFKNDFNDSDI